MPMLLDPLVQRRKFNPKTGSRLWSCQVTGRGETRLCISWSFSIFFRVNIARKRPEPNRGKTMERWWLS
jgi:hypothetical protein